MAFVFASITSDLLALVAIIITSAYFYVKFITYTYWTRRGVPQVTPTFPVGNFGSAFLLRTHIGLYLQDVYNKSTTPIIGIYQGLRPTLLIKDPEILRLIFVKDFAHFQDRGFYSDEDRDPLTGQLFLMNGEKWRNLRNKLSPTFTSGKLKSMFPTLVECGGPLIDFMDKVVANGEVIEMKEILARYTTNVIASVAFGIEVDCIADPEQSFRKFGRKVVEPSLRNGVFFVFFLLFPEFLPIINFKSVEQEVEEFIISMVKQTLNYREQNNVTRKDFFQLLVQLRNMGNVQSDGDWETKITDDESKKSLNINQVAAQAFVFLIAGFETSSTTMSFCLYQLARNMDIQKRVQQEIDEVLKKHNGQITYESISEMNLLEWCIDEALRMHPPLVILNRECTKQYTIPDTDVVIEKGTPIIIPAYALQRDPKYYPNPEEFIPERFSNENSAEKSFVNRTYMPFGEGPRMCIGLRLGIMQSKVGLLMLLQNYNIELAGNTLKPLFITPKSFIMPPPEGGFDFKVSKR